ncbi:MAG: acyl-CoA reductase, partial [Flammeovirgaceae bacterium]
MTLEERIAAFSNLGNRLQNLAVEEKNTLFNHAKKENAWFTEDNCERALNNICLFLQQSVLSSWLKSYPFGNSATKSVGVAMAGNIPLVGFHDLLCVLLS